MPPAQKPAGAEGAERALPREQPVTADAATPTPANKGSASAAGAEVISKEHTNKILWETMICSYLLVVLQACLAINGTKL